MKIATQHRARLEARIDAFKEVADWCRIRARDAERMATRNTGDRKRALGMEAGALTRAGLYWDGRVRELQGMAAGKPVQAPEAGAGSGVAATPPEAAGGKV